MIWIICLAEVDWVTSDNDGCTHFERIFRNRFRIVSTKIYIGIGDGYFRLSQRNVNGGTLKCQHGISGIAVFVYARTCIGVYSVPTEEAGTRCHGKSDHQLVPTIGNITVSSGYSSDIVFGKVKTANAYLTVSGYAVGIISAADTSRCAHCICIFRPYIGIAVLTGAGIGLKRNVFSRCAFR